jgi:hypothetical protein
MAEESIREIEKEMATVRDAYSIFASRSNEAFSEIANQAAVQFQNAMQGLANRIGQIEVPGDVITSKLGVASDSIITALDGLRASLSSGSREPVSALDAVRSSLTTGSQQFGQSLNDSVLVVARAAREIDEIQGTMAAAYRKMAEAASISGEAAIGAQRFTKDVGQTAVAMEQLRGRAAELGRALSEIISDLQTRGNVYRSEVDQARQLLQSVVSDIQSHGNAFTDAVVESANDLREAIKDART